MKEAETILLDLVRASIWGAHYDLNGKAWSHEQYQAVMGLAKEQAVAGLVAQALMDSGVKLESRDALEVFGLVQQVRQRNKVMDTAVVELCQMMAEAHIRIFVFKGQTIATFYPDSGLRQCGDIDFYCHPDDWEKAIRFFREELGLNIKDTNSEKHVEWQYKGVQYEMHRMLTAFAYPKHQKYWDEVVMTGVKESQSCVGVKGYSVPALPPTINVLYTFVHIFYHLIIEGIGLRQFCDLAMLMNGVRDQIDKEELEKSLNGIGLMNAFLGVGALMVDYIGYPESIFPYHISEKWHNEAPKLLSNILERGNFGHNVKYAQSHGVIHGIQHLWEIGKQSAAFYHYAPAEALWRIPDMFKWWGIKLWRMARGIPM